MNDDKLVGFLTGRIAQLKELSTLAEAVLSANDLHAMPDAYRTLIKRVKGAWKAIEKADRDYEKRMQRTPGVRQDVRRPWFILIRTVLQKASSHSRPPANSRDLRKILDAAYVIKADISCALFDLEQRLTETWLDGKPDGGL